MSDHSPLTQLVLPRARSMSDATDLFRPANEAAAHPTYQRDERPNFVQFRQPRASALSKAAPRLPTATSDDASFLMKCWKSVFPDSWRFRDRENRRRLFFSGGCLVYAPARGHRTNGSRPDERSLNEQFQTFRAVTTNPCLTIMGDLPLVDHVRSYLDSVRWSREHLHRDRSRFIAANAVTANTLKENFGS